MNETLNNLRLLQEFAPSLGGVFSLSDIKTVFRDKAADQTSRIVTMLDRASLLNRFIRGFYYTPGSFDLCRLSQKICPNSYISFEKVLSDKRMIAPIPTFEVSAVKTTPTRTYRDEKYTIRQYRISRQLFFGFSYRNGVAYADAEKALIDLLYYYQKGRKPLVSLDGGIDYSLINRKKFDSYLRKYRNPRFQKFVKNITGRIK
ncbi:MAG: hypothetical protein Q8O19_01475 [Rectinemataceae bacterium]|nr:hypothetical protein [Rectinemataceae bacterium]